MHATMAGGGGGELNLVDVIDWRPQHEIPDTPILVFGAAHFDVRFRKRAGTWQGRRSCRVTCTLRSMGAEVKSQ